MMSDYFNMLCGSFERVWTFLATICTPENGESSRHQTIASPETRNTDHGTVTNGR